MAVFENVILGALVAAAAAGLVLLVFALVIRRGDAVYIAPLDVAGEADSSVLGQALAQMLRARLERLSRELESARQVFAASAAEASADAQTPISDLEAQPWFSLPASVADTKAPLEPPNIEFSLGRVSLGPLLSWVQHWALDTRTLRFSVLFCDGSAITTGSLEPLRMTRVRTLWVESSPAPDDIVTKVAYAILQSAVHEDSDDGAPSTTFAALESDEFADFMWSLVELARLRRRTLLGGSRDEAVPRFASVHDRLAPIAQRFPEWETLKVLTVSVAEQAERFEAARHLGEQKAPVAPEDSTISHDAFIRKVYAHAHRLFPGNEPPGVRVGGERFKQMPGMLSYWDPTTETYLVAEAMVPKPRYAVVVAVDAMFMARHFSRCAGRQSPEPWNEVRHSVTEYLAQTDPREPGRHSWSAPRYRLYQALSQLSASEKVSDASVRNLAFELHRRYDCGWSTPEEMYAGVRAINLASGPLVADELLASALQDVAVASWPG